MTKSSHTLLLALAALAAAMWLGTSTAAQEVASAQQAPQERIAAIKQALQASAVALREYEWIETTIVSHKGEEKKRTQQRCYYGADGTVQKISLDEPAAEASSGGRGRRRGSRVVARVVERKVDAITEFMEQAVATVHAYLPPDPAGLQQAKDAGRVSMQPLTPGESARVAFADLVKTGDALSIDLDLAANRILAIAVASYVEEPDDVVSLSVTFGELTGGISYQSEIVLDAPTQDVKVVVQNTGYRKQVP